MNKFLIQVFDSMRLKIIHKLPLYIGLIFIVFLAGLIGKELLTMVGAATLAEQDAKLEREWEFTSHMKNVNILLRDADLGLQAYFLSRNKSYLPEPKVLRDRYAGELKFLNATPADTPVRRESFATFLTITDQHLQHLEDEIADAASQRGEPYRYLPKPLNQNWENIQALRDVEAEIEKDQAVLIGARAEEVRHRYWYVPIYCLLACVVFVGLLVLFYRLNRRYSTQLRLSTDELILKNDNLQSNAALRAEQLTVLSHHLLAVSEQEKSRLARELHDELGASLMVIRLDLLAVQEELEQIAHSSAKKIRNVLQVLQKTYDIKRRIIENLHPTMLEHLGLTAAIRMYSEEMAQRTGLRIEVNIADELTDLDPAYAIAIYRIVQESITNAMKYAKASQLSISLQHCHRGLRLRIVDNGIGLPRNVLSTKSKAHGIIGMRERATLLGGTFDIRRDADGKGTCIDVILPSSSSGISKAQSMGQVSDIRVDN